MSSYFFLGVESEYLATERQCRVVWREPEYPGSCLALSLSSTLVLDKLLTSLCLSFLICTMGIIFNSEGCCED